MLCLTEELELRALIQMRVGTFVQNVLSLLLLLSKTIPELILFFSRILLLYDALT